MSHGPLPPLPSWMVGLREPVTKDDAIAHAEAHGASSDVLEFLEELPAAVFLSEEGMAHVLNSLRGRSVEPTGGNGALSEDGADS